MYQDYSGPAVRGGAVLHMPGTHAPRLVFLRLMNTRSYKQPGPAVLFDGHCRLCCGSVRFILKRDRAGRFRFASLQSAPGRRLRAGCDISPGHTDTLVLIDDDGCHVRSTAALRIARRLSGLWPLLYGLIIIPRPVRDAVYTLIARQRYRLFGRRAQCYLPDRAASSRFLA